MVLSDTQTSQNRGIESDATETLTNQDNMRVRQIESLNVYVFAPATTTIAARQIRDDIEADVKPAIMRSLLGWVAPTVYQDEKWCMLTPTNDGFAEYNGSYYVHRFGFERSLDLVTGDSVGAGLTRAWRDTTLQSLNDNNETTQQTEVNMDSDPL